MKESICRLAGVTVGAIALVVAPGCGVRGSGPTDDELVAATVEGWREAMVAGDIDRVMATYSEEFSCFDAPDRGAIRAYLSGLLEQGALEGVEVFVDRAEATREGEVYRVFPVEMVLANGSLTVSRLTLREEDGAWLIVNQEW